MSNDNSNHSSTKKTVKDPQAVNKALNFPGSEEFDKDLTALMEAENAEEGDSIIISLIDLDHFMDVNTRFGMEAGDKVLIDTGLYIKNSIPEDAKVYRIGGDEFGIIFHGDFEKEDVFLALEDLRRGYPVVNPDGEKISLSIGMSVAFEDANRVQELTRKADSAMFRAKYSGRDRVAMAKEEKMVPKTSHYTQEQLKRLTKLSKREGVGEAILLREALDMLFKKYDI